MPAAYSEYGTMGRASGRKKRARDAIWSHILTVPNENEEMRTFQI